MSKQIKRVVVIGAHNYGLYFGRITATDAEIAATKSVQVEDCRHISHWKGEPGGITSLAASGPMKGSRVGAACPRALITDVKNVYECSEAAAARFDDLKPSAG